ncbi:MAG: polysulfide reductase NrfD [Deltaproteobacteria bacterium]|nr:polysulfide reductase NrfD [Deltaproteobacteria bacterium]
MRDQVSWGLYISNFTFLVGVAAAAVLLVVPAYIYHFKPIHEIVLFGELMAVVAVTMCLMFVSIDMGRLDRAWHILPFIGMMHFPASMLAWDVVVLNGYLAINVIVTFYALYMMAHHKEFSFKPIYPIIILSIPWAIGIHTVTAFLYNGLPSRPFWNASILAPRFIAGALCSGPALMIIVFQIVRKVSDIKITNRALFKIAQLVAYAVGIDMFLEGCEIFKEFYSNSIHLAPMKYVYLGLDGNYNLVPWTWAAIIAIAIAFIIFLQKRTRENILLLNIGCVLIFFGVYIEKGMGCVVPGFIPGTLGEIYQYSPSFTEKAISAGVFAFGALFYTFLLKIAIPIYTGKLRFYKDEDADKVTA